MQSPGGTTEAKNSELWLFSCGHLETEGCARQRDYQGSSDSASKSQHGKARSWPYKRLCLYTRPLQPAVSWKPTKAAVSGVPYSRHVIALLQKQLLTTVPAHVSIAQKCQHPFHRRAVAPEGVVSHSQHPCSAASYESGTALE